MGAIGAGRPGIGAIGAGAIGRPAWGTKPACGAGAMPLGGTGPCIWAVGANAKEPGAGPGAGEGIGPAGPAGRGIGVAPPPGGALRIGAGNPGAMPGPAIIVRPLPATLGASITCTVINELPRRSAMPGVSSMLATRWPCSKKLPLVDPTSV